MADWKAKYLGEVKEHNRTKTKLGNALAKIDRIEKAIKRGTKIYRGGEVRRVAVG